MIRTLSLGLVAAVVLTGCVSSGYGYRSGVGDYYHGRSSAAYYGAGVPYGGVGYGYPGGLYGSIGYGYPAYYGWGHYAYGFPYSGLYYGPYAYYGPVYPRYHAHDAVPREPQSPRGRRMMEARPPRPGDAPWRNLNSLRDAMGQADPGHGRSRYEVQAPQAAVSTPVDSSLRTAPSRREALVPRSRAAAGMQPRPAPRRMSGEDRRTP